MERLATPSGPRGRAKQRHRSRGQSVVEFALMLPVFLVVVVGVVDFGTLLFARMTVIDLAREGAQFGSTLNPGGSTQNPGSIESNVHIHVTTETTSLNPAYLTVSVSCWKNITSSPSQLGSCSSANVAGPVNDSVKVVIGYAYHPFFPLWFGSTINVSSTEWMTLYPPPSS